MGVGSNIFARPMAATRGDPSGHRGWFSFAAPCAHITGHTMLGYGLMSFKIDRQTLYKTENFHARDTWCARLGLKNGDKVFDLAWKRLISGEIYDDGPVLASDGRYVQAHRNERYRVMLLGESEIPWFKGLMLEASKRVTDDVDPEWTGIDGFLGMVGCVRGGIDTVTTNAINIWKELESQNRERAIGERLRSIHGIAPYHRKGYSELFIDTGRARDIAAGVISISDIEISEDWVDVDEIDRLFSGRMPWRQKWREISRNINEGCGMTLPGGDVHVVARRTAPVLGVSARLVNVAHRSALPIIAREVGFDNPHVFAPKSVLPVASLGIKKTHKPMSIVMRQNRSSKRTEAKADSLGVCPGGNGKVLLVDDVGNPWALALGCGADPKSDNFKSFYASAKISTTSSEVVSNYMRKAGLSGKSSDISNKSKAFYLSFGDNMQVLEGEDARLRMGLRVTDGNSNVKTVWDENGFGVHGVIAVDKKAIDFIIKSLIEGSLAVGGSRLTGPILVFSDNIPEGVNMDKIEMIIEDHQSINKNADYVRLRIRSMAQDSHLKM